MNWSPIGNYRLVVTVLKTEAFARYRIGDMFAVSLFRWEIKARICPNWYSWIGAVGDRYCRLYPDYGENSIEDVVIRLSDLSIKHWIAKKNMTQRRPYLHIYVELNPADLGRMAVSTRS